MTANKIISVGQSNADVIGSTNCAIQIALDALAQRGGGEVHVQPGQYLIEGAIRLRTNVKLIGDRANTRFVRPPLVCSKLALDADVGQKQITPIDANIFKPGMSVCIRDDAGWAYATMPYTITHIEDGVLYLDDYLNIDKLAERNGYVVNYYPLIHGKEIHHATVDGFTLDSHVEDSGELDKIWSNNFYTFRCTHCTFRNITSLNCRGDGGCFGKTSEYTTVENCEFAHNKVYGLHPGSHSAHCTVRNLHIHHNGSDGLYICWGIHHSTFENCDIHHNGHIDYRNGISIGHKDADNLIANNKVYENSKHGICVRRKTAGNGAHRNIFRDNVVENNGTARENIPQKLFDNLPLRELISTGIYVNGCTQDLTFENNTICESRTGSDALQQVGMYFAQNVSSTTMTNNKITGHPECDILDESKQPAASPAD